MEIEKTTLELIKLRMYQKLSFEFLKSIEIDTELDRIAETLTMLISANIFGQHNRQKYSIGIEVPKNLWQHTREVFLPNFWLKWFPVKTKVLSRTIEFDHMALCPDIKLPPDSGQIYMHTPVPPDYNVRKIKE
jgi:hypothetical protein